MNQKIPIGIGGVAKSGKDTLCAILINHFKKQNVRAKRYALADELKANIRDQLIEKYNIDVNNCTAEQKEIIRPDLVAYGKAKRFGSNGKYWTELLEHKILNDKDVDIPIVTDIRYDEYLDDELWWLQTRMQGIMVHVSRFSLNEHDSPIVDPANEDEALNDPRIKIKADLTFRWETHPATGPDVLIDELETKYMDIIRLIELTYLSHVSNVI